MTTWRDASSGTTRDPVPLSVALDRVARHLGAPATAVTSAVFAHWEDLVGPQIAAHTRPKTLRGGVLAIVADKPIWASQLRFLGAELLARVQAVPGGERVTEVRIGVAVDGGLPRS